MYRIQFVDVAQKKGVTYKDPLTDVVTPCIRPEDIYMSWRQNDDDVNSEKIWYCAHGSYEEPVQGLPAKHGAWVLQDFLMRKLGLKYDTPSHADNLTNKHPEREATEKETDFDFRTGGFVAGLWSEVKASEVKKLNDASKGYHNYKLVVKLDNGKRSKRGRIPGKYSPDYKVLHEPPKKGNKKELARLVDGEEQVAKKLKLSDFEVEDPPIQESPNTTTNSNLASLQLQYEAVLSENEALKAAALLATAHPVLEDMVLWQEPLLPDEESSDEDTTVIEEPTVLMIAKEKRTLLDKTTAALATEHQVLEDMVLEQEPLCPYEESSDEDTTVIEEPTVLIGKEKRTLLEKTTAALQDAVIVPTSVELPVEVTHLKQAAFNTNENPVVEDAALELQTATNPSEILVDEHTPRMISSKVLALMQVKPGNDPAAVKAINKMVDETFWSKSKRLEEKEKMLDLMMINITCKITKSIATQKKRASRKKPTQVKKPVTKV